jgi:hypothetical protein
MSQWVKLIIHVPYIFFFHDKKGKVKWLVRLKCVNTKVPLFAYAVNTIYVLQVQTKSMYTQSFTKQELKMITQNYVIVIIKTITIYI